jgi:hypothetical protein
MVEQIPSKTDKEVRPQEKPDSKSNRQSLKVDTSLAKTNLPKTTEPDPVDKAA